jgi:hypothetical protein
MYRALLAICALVLYGSALEQSDNRVAPSQTFHVQGIVGDSNGARILHTEVHFVGDNGDQTVPTDNQGFYQTDLPIGIYTMTAAFPTSRYRVNPFTKYVRFFRVSSPATVTLNGFLFPYSDCDGVWSDEEGWKDVCGGADSFPFPSNDAVPLRLDIRYLTRERGEKLFHYSSFMKYPVVVAYNLFALRADSVDYDQIDKTIKGYGHVVIEDQSGQTSATSAAFKFDDGKAVRIW